MKECTKCKEIKKIENFSSNKRTKDGLQRMCKKCTKEAQMTSYNKNKEAHNIRVKKQKEKTDNYITNKRKEGKCVKCGLMKWYLLDFHHIDPSSKDYNLGSLMGTGSYLKVKKEFKKCLLLCKNCHSEFHYFEKTKNIILEDYIK